MRLLTAVFLIIFSPLILAADLTDADVKNWIEKMPQLEEWLSAHEDQLPETMPEDSGTLDEMMTQGITELKQAGLYDEYNKKVRAAGYSNVEQWSEMTRRISLAFLALEIENEPVTISQLEAQLKQIKDSDLPAEQKQMMTQMMNSSLVMMRAVQNVSETDKKVVRPYKKQLQDRFQDSEDE